MRYINVFAFLAFWAFKGVGQSAPDLFFPDDTFRLVVIGSSTAAGTGARPVDSAWVNRYRTYLQGINPANEVVNLALGGYSTYRLMPSGFVPPKSRPAPDTSRNISKALAFKPDAIIVNLPSNDAAAGYDLEEQLQNFDTIVQCARAAGVPIWICSTQPRNFSADKVLVQLIARDTILTRYANQAINFWEGLAMPNGLIAPEFNSGDGIHLNNAGHRLLFDRVREKNIPETLAVLRRMLKWIRMI